jgi:hypothetical protein
MEASDAHFLSPLICRGFAEVRVALLSRAERDRGLPASSRSVGETGLATFSNVGSFGSASTGR